jgi:hypothetical protein
MLEVDHREGLYAWMKLRSRTICLNESTEQNSMPERVYGADYLPE